MSKELKIAILGCGLIGERRAMKAAPFYLYDTNADRAQLVAEKSGGVVVRDPERIWQDPEVEAVVVATPNRYLYEYGLAALKAGKHLFVEKPGACTYAEWKSLNQAKGKSIAKIGFNHRFHPAALRLWEEWQSRREDERALWIRGAYGHGGRPGYEKEWRFDPKLSGGGEIIDQGVHLLDLAGWYLGESLELQSVHRMSAHYQASVEDNGFLSLQSQSGAHVQLHCSVTQWKNLFRFELCTSHRLFIWEGLGNKNYGEESLTIHERKPEGGAPLTQRLLFTEEKSDSWSKEWDHFKAAIRDRRPCWSELSQMGWLFQLLDQVHIKEMGNIR